MFSRGHLQRIESLLEALDKDLLRDASCYLGGGTAIALRFGGFRESIGVDFLVSSTSGYREIRELVKTSGFDSLAVREIPVVRAPVTDQYGIRAVLEVGGVPIKFEIVLEGRLSFDAPGPGGRDLRHNDVISSRRGGEQTPRELRQVFRHSGFQSRPDRPRHDAA